MRSAVAGPPPTLAEPVVEVLYGVEVTDPYRWLEGQDSPKTRKWIEEQALYARSYFEQIPRREDIRRRVKQLLEMKGTLSEPWNIGSRYFFLQHRADDEQAVVVMRDGLCGEDEVLIDPALRGTGPHTAVSIVAISHDARFLAYAVREGGTDHAALEIFDLQERAVLPDRLPDGFLSGFAFAPDNSGFYYSHRELDDQRPHYRAAYWHSFGSEHSQDKEVFLAGEGASLFLTVLCSPEANRLAYVVFTTGKRRSTSVYFQSISNEPGSAEPLLEDIEGCFAPFFIKDQLYAFTDLLAPNFRIVHIDPSSPHPSQWMDIVPETNKRIQQFATAGDHVFVTRIDRFNTNLESFHLCGDGGGESVFSTFGSIDLLNRDHSSNNLFYSMTSIAEPPALHYYDTYEKKQYVCEEITQAHDTPEITIEEVSFPSCDGTLVPLLIAARRDKLHLGPLPTFLTGYGGFGSCVTPRFTAFASFLIEQGFLFAVPALRGGSELGEEWHRAGMRHNHQNSFDDFIAAAEWLIEQRRSEPGRIAIGGGSNAGLLVGVAITQSPDLFRAAICLGPLLDMTRYHLFDFAAGWSEEYGSPEDEQDCKYLLSYSPYHRVRDGIAYPAVLLISGDADTRCNPMHARKMAARLQAATTSELPILLDYKPAWGHTPVQPRSVRVEALTDRLTFICHELQVEIQPRSF